MLRVRMSDLVSGDMSDKDYVSERIADFVRASADIADRLRAGEHVEGFDDEMASALCAIDFEHVSLSLVQRGGELFLEMA